MRLVLFEVFEFKNIVAKGVTIDKIFDCRGCLIFPNNFSQKNNLDESVYSPLLFEA